MPLAELLTSMNNPLTGLSWISSRHGPLGGIGYEVWATLTSN
ncbi:hypothetical protein [Salinispora arenicola]|nr:hypothetical protein [Salinispora arenicola]